MLGRFLNVSGEISAIPAGEVLSTEGKRGEGRLKAAAEIVRVPGGRGELRDVVDDFALGLILESWAVVNIGRYGDSLGNRMGVSVGVLYGELPLENELDRSPKGACGGTSGPSLLKEGAGGMRGNDTSS